MADDRVVEFLQVGEPTCPACDYRLAGLKDSVCPECGIRLALRLSAEVKPKVLIPAAWVLWWNVLGGVLYLAYTMIVHWEMHDPLKSMGQSLNQPVPSFAEFYIQSQTWYSFAVAGCNGIAIVLGSVGLILLRRGLTSGRISKWIGWYCGLSLAISVALTAILFGE